MNDKDVLNKSVAQISALDFEEQNPFFNGNDDDCSEAASLFANSRNNPLLQTDSGGFAAEWAGLSSVTRKSSQSHPLDPN